MSGSTKSTTDVKELEEQVRVLRHDLSEATRLLKEFAEGKAVETGRALHDEADQLIRKTKHAAEGAKERALAASGSIEDYIAEKPLQSAFVALLIGFVIGTLGRR